MPCRGARISGRRGKFVSAQQLRRECPIAPRQIERLQSTRARGRCHLHNSIATYWIVCAGLSDFGLSMRLSLIHISEPTRR
eukprot:8059755-Lingulodinium_polyedra.AAC.1